MIDGCEGGKGVLHAHDLHLLSVISHSILDLLHVFLLHGTNPIQHIVVNIAETHEFAPILVVCRHFKEIGLVIWHALVTRIAENVDDLRKSCPDLFHLFLCVASLVRIESQSV